MSEEIENYYGIPTEAQKPFKFANKIPTKEDLNKIVCKQVVEIASLQQKVEQLEKQNKILKENAKHNDKVVDKVNWENMFLKGKLKDLKERIMLKQLRLVNEETYNILHSDLNELLEVLDREIEYEQ